MRWTTLSPVTEGVHSAEGITAAGEAAGGTVGEVALLTVLTLQARVPRHAGTLASALVPVVWVQHPFATAGATDLYTIG